MDYRNLYNFYYRNNTEVTSNASFTTSKDDIFKNNLQNKKVRVQKFYCNNSKVPIFIPDRMINSAYFSSVVPNSTTNTYYDNRPAGLAVISGTSLDSQSLKYFINFRKGDNSESHIVFLRQPLVDPDLEIPPHPIVDDQQYYTNKFYWYYDFTHFLSQIELAFSNFATLMAFPWTGRVTNFWQNKDGYFQLLARTELLADWDIEISESLLNLFPFKNIKINSNSDSLTGNNTTGTSYRLVFGDETLTVNTKTFLEAQAVFYDTIFPFMQLLFVSDNLGLNPINFINNAILNSNVQTSLYENAILSYDIGTDMFIGIYNFWKYTNENDSIWANFRHGTSFDPNMSIKIYLRLKNDVLIPYPIGPNELFTYSLEVKFHGS